jgi:hypothetical protein
MIATGLVFMSFPSFANASGKAGLTPHKALYDIKMVARHSGATVLNISGQMFYEWEQDCEAWISNHKFNLYYEYADSPAMHITSDFSTYENFDGKNFEFTSRRERNGELYQEIRGNAELDDKGKGLAHYKSPESITYTLRKNTQFPMAHTISVLKAIKEGKKFYNATIFDGSDEDGPVEINTFIGEDINALANIKPSSNLDTTLLNLPAKSVRMAFFPLKDNASESEYEMTITLLENGIISDMLVEYKEFSVSQKLIAVEAINLDECSNK